VKREFVSSALHSAWGELRRPRKVGSEFTHSLVRNTRGSSASFIVAALVSQWRRSSLNVLCCCRDGNSQPIRLSVPRTFAHSSRRIVRGTDGPTHSECLIHPLHHESASSSSAFTPIAFFFLSSCLAVSVASTFVPLSCLALCLNRI